MTSLRRMSIPDLAMEPALVQLLIDGGETLFVEHKERDPRNGLGPTVASFANMLGGWLLIGVDDSHNIVGYEPPGKVDLQDYIRDLLRLQVDPLPPFVAVTMRVGEQPIGVVRVAESSDTPHVTSDGVIYVRNPGGKERVTDHRDILAMARRGDQARQEAGRRQYGLPLIRTVMATPSRIFGDEPGQEARYAALLECIVRATPFTVSGMFADRSLSNAAAEIAHSAVSNLFPEPRTGHRRPTTQVEPHARGVHCMGSQMGTLQYQDLAIDAGGVVAVRSAWRRVEGVLHGPNFATHTLRPLIETASDVLAGLDGYGRAAVGLELRGAANLTLQWTPQTVGQLDPSELIDDHRLEIGGDLAVPATSEDISELADRWLRELARAAHLPFWEPGPVPPSIADTES